MSRLKVIPLKDLVFYDVDTLTAANPAGTMDEDLVSQWIDIGDCDDGVRIFGEHTAGALPMGTLRLQASVDPAALKNNVTEVAGSDVTVPVAAPGVGSALAGAVSQAFSWSLHGKQRPGRFVRAVYDYTSGTAVLTARVEGEGAKTP